MSGSSKYRAFISYRHVEPDKSFAAQLERALEAYYLPKHLIGADGRIGPIPPRLGQFCRDLNDYPARASLDDVTRSAMSGASDFLIVLCSPAAAKSKWVNEEIRTFKALGRSDRILAVIVGGEPGSAENDCFPPALRQKVDAQGQLTGEPEATPLAADMQTERDGADHVRLKLVCGMLGLFPRTCAKAS